MSISGAGRKGGNAGSDEEVWAHPIIKPIVIAGPVYDLLTRTAVSNVFLYARTTATTAQNEEHQTLDESTTAIWRVELCACSRRTDKVHFNRMHLECQICDRKISANSWPCTSSRFEMGRILLQGMIQ
jgi:hypothetical protein